jgi:hypothetical protein
MRSNRSARRQTAWRSGSTVRTVGAGCSPWPARRCPGCTRTSPRPSPGGYYLLVEELTRRSRALSGARSIWSVWLFRTAHADPFEQSLNHSFRLGRWAARHDLRTDGGGPLTLTLNRVKTTAEVVQAHAATPPRRHAATQLVWPARPATGAAVTVAARRVRARPIQPHALVLGDRPRPAAPTGQASTPRAGPGRRAGVGPAGQRGPAPPRRPL